MTNGIGIPYTVVTELRKPEIMASALASGVSKEQIGLR